MNDETETRSEIAALPEGGVDRMLFDPSAFEQAQRVAKLLSQSQLVPQHMQGNVPDCFMALHMAHRLREDPLMVAQNIVIIQGTAGWKAQWLISRTNNSGAFATRIKYHVEGDGKPIDIKRRIKDGGQSKIVDAQVPNLTVTAYVKTHEGDQVSHKVSMHDAIAEGWTNNPKYSSLGELMLSYRAASFLIRLHCPEVTLGYHTAEEVEDMAAAGQLKDVTPTQESGATEALGQLQTSKPPQQPEPEHPVTATETQQQTQGAETQPKQAEPAKTAEPQQAKNTVVLYDAEQAHAGEYQRAGAFLNALVKLLTNCEGDPPAARVVSQTNAPTVDRIRASGRHADKLADLDALVERLTAQPDSEWIAGYDGAAQGEDAQDDDAILGDINDGLEEAVVAGNVEEIRKRIPWAQKISDAGLREDALDELDEALTRAQGAGEQQGNGAQGAFGGV